MSERGRDRREAWIEEVDRQWQPEPLDEAGRVRFDARLRERLDAERRGTPGWLAPAASALAVVALAWWGFRPPESPPVANPPQAAQDIQLAAWEWELLLGDELSEQSPGALPEEYSAIATAFLIR